MGETLRSFEGRNDGVGIKFQRATLLADQGLDWMSMGINGETR